MGVRHPAMIVLSWLLSITPPSAAALAAEVCLLQLGVRKHFEAATSGFEVSHEKARASFPEDSYAPPDSLITASVEIQTSNNAADDFDVHQSLWSGMDSVAQNEFMAPHVARANSTGSTSAVQILGHYNTGTNLLGALLEDNFHDKFKLNKGTLGPGCSFWKHSSLAVLKKRSPSTLDDCGSVLGIAMIRDPLSWLASFKRVAYDLYACKDWKDWLTRPCTYPPGTPSQLGSSQYSSVEEIWNAWAQDYSSLASFGFDHGLVIRNEDLVLDVEGQLARIAEVAGLAAPKKVHEVEACNENMSPTSSHEESGREDAIEQIKSQSYLDEFTPQEIEEVCSRLDSKLLAEYGYTHCAEV